MEDKIINIKNNRECFFDDYLLDRKNTTAESRLHNPTPREIVLTHDEPWEGDGCNYHNIFYDNGIWRMYYLAWKMLDLCDGVRVCYAESKDGVHYVKPNLNKVEYNGNKNNNILFDDSFDNFMVFKDTNPNCLKGQKYKAIASGNIETGEPCLYAYYSDDAINFTRGNVVSLDGKFDSLNVAFYDEVTKTYKCYFRGFHYRQGDHLKKDLVGEGVRDIRYIESNDFINWTNFKILDFKNAEEVPLYTSAIIPYYRAPHTYIGFPTRYIERKEWTANYDELCGKEKRKARMAKNKRYGLALTDCAFMFSRDGYHFKLYEEAFISPPPENDCNWVYGDCYPTRGIVETPATIDGADNEISIFLNENHWQRKPAVLRRYTLRRDGFVSLHAGGSEELITTKPFIYNGEKLKVNFSTSARGYMYFTIKGENGIEFTSDETFGNSTNRTVTFSNDLVKQLSGTPVVLTVRLKDADLYSIKFE